MEVTYPKKEEPIPDENVSSLCSVSNLFNALYTNCAGYTTRW